MQERDTPTMRLISLLEVIASSDRLHSRLDLVRETGIPGPTLHRMLTQLEAAGLLQRDGDGRRYDQGLRLRQLAERLLLNNVRQGAQRAVLSQLAAQVGESCKLTALSGSEVLYLDRVEGAAPLRFHLRPGARVPWHCSASGKLFLGQMRPAQRRRLIGHAPLQAHTGRTLTEPEALEEEIVRVKRQGFALDNEEFLPGMLSIAVLVPSPGGRFNLCVAAQAPVMRLTPARAVELLPVLRYAAQALGRIEAPDPAETVGRPP
jgi:IclR family acetate operon transcriptional repressor